MSMPKARSTKSAIFLVIALIVGLGGLAVVEDVQGVHAAVRVHDSDRQAQQTMLAGLTTQYLTFAWASLDQVATSGSWVLHPQSAANESRLSGLGSDLPLLTPAALALVDPSGRVLASSGDPTGLPAAGTPTYAPAVDALLRHQPGFTGLIQVPGRAPMVGFLAPLVQGTTVRAVVVAFADTTRWPLAGYLRQLKLAPGAVYNVVDGNGVIVNSSDPTLAGGKLTGPIAAGLAAGGSGLVQQQFAGHRMVGSYASAGLDGWGAVTAQPATLYYQGLHDSQIWLLVAIAGILTVSLLALIGVNHRRHQAVGRLAAEAIHDPLTGAGTRRLLDLRMSEASARQVRHDGMLGLLFIDIDGFKQINDTYGHHIGDQVLAELAERFRTCLRGEDLLARVGGDEFVVVAEGLTDPAEASRLASRVVEAARPVISVAGHDLAVTVSVGAVLAPDAATGPGDVLAAADAAMYQAKQDHDRYHAIVLPELAVPRQRQQDAAAWAATVRKPPAGQG